MRRAPSRRQPDPRHGLHRRVRLDDVVRDACLRRAGDRVAAVVQDPVLTLPFVPGRGFPGADAIREYSRNTPSATSVIFTTY